MNNFSILVRANKMSYLKLLKANILLQVNGLLTVLSPSFQHTDWPGKGIPVNPVIRIICTTE
jgi:hypothetical protein